MILRAENVVNAEIVDMDMGKRILLFLFMLAALVVTAGGLAPAYWVYHRFIGRADALWEWCLLATAVILAFHYGYIFSLLAIRLVLPKPKAGNYLRGEDGRPPAAAVLYMLNMLLLKLRHNMPWSSTLVPTLVAIPPLASIYRKLWGPDTRSLTFGDTAKIFDPWLLTVGKRVQFGWGCLLTAHLFDNRGLRLLPVVIEDDALIGAEAFIAPGVTVGHHSIVAIRAVVTPNTKIGPYELWGGNPAKKLKDLPRSYVESGERLKASDGRHLEAGEAD